MTDGPLIHVPEAQSKVPGCERTPCCYFVSGFTANVSEPVDMPEGEEVGIQQFLCCFHSGLEHNDILVPR